MHISTRIIPGILLVGAALVLLPRLLTRWSATLRIARGLRTERRERTYDIERVRAYHDGLPEAERSDALDAGTWNDLDLDQLLVALDRTESQPGLQYLYHLLHTPRFDRVPLDRLERAVRRFAADATLADRVRTELHRLDDLRAAFLIELVHGDLPQRPALWWLFPLLTLSAFACLALVAIWPHAALLWLVICLVNIGVQAFYKPRVHAIIPALHEVPTLLRVSRALGALGAADLGGGELDERVAALRHGADRLASLRRTTSWLVFEPDQTNEAASALYAYVNLFCLFDVNAFVFSIDVIRAQRETLRRVLEAIGFLDAVQSVARWRSELVQWTTPEFSDAEKRLDVVSVAHPLLEAPVANSLAIRDTSVLITGSNMSGKTTFVRTLGVNAVLAQTIHTVCAAQWRAPFLAVRTSIGRGDSLVQGKSYYLSEVESVLALIRAKEDGRQHLFLLDEIFRGTNTTERVAAARAVLAYLDRGWDIVVVATHDVELLEMLGTCYAPYHFREQIEHGSLEFDYLIRAGPSSTRNAIALLELMNYPEAVIADALAGVRERR